MTITQEHTTLPEVKSARKLITPEQFLDVASTVQRNNEGMAANVAERITEEALNRRSVLGGPTRPPQAVTGRR
ncbi:hypothetical protein ACWGLP_25775 [Streptomyces lydicus]